jgi:parvulin-like peptidyl-prolyl isomerase
MAVVAAGVTLVLGGCTANPNKRGGAQRPPAGTVAPTDALNTRLPTTEPIAGGGEVVATVDGNTITMAQLSRPLLEAYGLNVLLNLVQLDLAKQQAAKAGLIVSPEDIQKEYDQTVQKLFSETQSKTKTELDEAEAKNDTQRVATLRADLKRENEQLLDQFLTQQRISRPEFMLVVEANAYLRKIAAGQMPTLTEQNLQEGWRARYGEKVVVRHIQLANLQEVAAAKAKLAAGEPFEKVAREMSRNARTRAVGGELPAFTMNNTNVPEEFKRVAFGLKVGEVSDPVQAEGSYHLLQLVQRIAPKAVKFEDVKEAVRQELTDRWVQNRVNELRAQLGRIALEQMQIKNPVLRKQFEDRLAERNGAIKDREQIKREIERTREQHEAATRAIGGVDAHLLPATGPTTAPAPAPAGAATAPASRATTHPTQRIEREAMPEVHITAPAASTPASSTAPAGNIMPAAGTQPGGLRPPATQPGAASAAPGPASHPSPELNK